MVVFPVPGVPVMRIAVPFVSSGNQFTFVLAWCSGRDFHDLFCLIILNPRRWLSPTCATRGQHTLGATDMTGLYYRSTAGLRGLAAFLKGLHQGIVLSGPPSPILTETLSSTYPLLLASHRGGWASTQAFLRRGRPLGVGLVEALLQQ